MKKINALFFLFAFCLFCLSILGSEPTGISLFPQVYAAEEETLNPDGAVTEECTQACGETESSGQEQTGTEEVSENETVTETEACVYGEPVVIPPTCTDDGYTTRVCELCGAEIITDIVPAVGHSTVKTEKKYASYTFTGNNEYYTCTVCNKVFKDAGCLTETTVEAEIIPLLVRSYKPGDVDNDGEITSVDARLALRCSVGLEKYDPSSDPFMASDIDVNYAVTAGDARMILRASVGLESITEEIHYHLYEGEDTTVSATCTKSGKVTNYCVICCKTITLSTEKAKGHEWDEGTETKAATCTDSGSKNCVCLVCGKEKTVTLKALGHKYDTATCTAPKTCTRCGETSGSALGHKWKDATCTAPKTCTRCGETTGSALGHKWNSGKIIKSPEYKVTGTKRYTCTVCKATKDEKIAALDYRFVNASDLYQFQTVIPAETPDSLITEGSEGLRVRWIIQKLGLGNGIGMGGALYDSEVMSAVKRFQSRHSLTADGIAGIKTWLAMGFTEEEWNICGAYHSPVQAKKDSTKAQLIEIMIARAREYLGSPYVIGASGPPGQKYGIDCSGLVMQALYAAGIDMKTITPVTHARPGHEYESRNIWNYGHFRKVNYEDRKRGDLIVYQNGYGTVNHIAIYLGNNQIIESWPNVVQISPIKDSRHGNVKGVLRVFE